MARTIKNYGGTDYISDKEFDYTTAIREAAAHGDYDYAASLERSRNAKIDGEGLSYAKTYKYQNGTSPTYKSKYGSRIDKTLSSIVNRRPFEYDYTKDDSYKALEEVYTQNGKYAMQDTLGDAAALTGGKASSAAVSASQQAYNRYMSELSANIPALEQAAYGRYRDEEASLYNQLGIYQQMDDIDYGRWRDSWNKDYMLNEDANEEAWKNKEFNRLLGRDAVEDARYDDKIAYERDMDSISRLMDTAQATGDYSVLRDNPEIADKYGFTEAVVAALNEAHAKGVPEKEVEKAFAKAQYMARFDDFSGFKDAGFTDAQIAKMEEYRKKGELREDALFAAQFGDYSELEEIVDGTSGSKKNNNVTSGDDIIVGTDEEADGNDLTLTGDEYEGFKDIQTAEQHIALQESAGVNRTDAVLQAAQMLVKGGKPYLAKELCDKYGVTIQSYDEWENSK